MSPDPTQADVEAYERQLEYAEEPIAPYARPDGYLVLAVSAFFVSYLIGMPLLEFLALSALVVLALRAIDYMDRGR